MTVTHTEIEFADEGDAAAFFSTLAYRPFRGTSGYCLVGEGFDDHGNETITFARKCCGETIKWQLAEQIKRRS